MLKLKQCPRCQGDLHLAKDYEGVHTACLQCGYRGYPADMVASPQLVRKRRRRNLKTAHGHNPE